MQALDTPPLTIGEYRSLVAAADPDSLLVPPRLLRRVVKADRKIGGLGLSVPHSRLHLIGREELLALATPAELGSDNLPQRVLLLPLPVESDLRRKGREKALADAWQALYHGAIHREFARLRDEKRLTPESVAQRVKALGEVAFAEAREVLLRDGHLSASDDASAYEEFAAVWSELHAFDPERLARTFPATEDRAAQSLLAQDFDGEALLRSCQPAGAELPFHEEPTEKSDAQDDAAAESQPNKAEEEEDKGNLVRAALLRHQEGEKGGLDALAARLLRDLQLPRYAGPAWRSCLADLLEPASKGYWNAEARLLYDLQAACIDAERPVYAADVVESLTTFFRRPVKRRLPDLPLVTALGDLRRARGRLPQARVPDPTRAALDGLLAQAVRRMEERIRETLRPKIDAALREAGLSHDGPAEQLAWDRLVEELLDRVVDRGYLGLGELRDTVARSRVNLPDLRSPLELATGDPLLRADSNLAVALDGIHQRGEAFLRWMQTLSSVFFGTVPGRLLTLYVLLPFLSAFIILLATDLVASEIRHYFPSLPKVAFTGAWSLAGLSLFFLLSYHVGPFRRAILRSLWLLWLAARGIAYDGPAFVLALPPVRDLLGSSPLVLAWRFLVLPVLWTAPVALALWLSGVPDSWLAGLAGGWFAACAVLLGTRPGLLAQEAVADAFFRSWKLLRDGVFLGLARGAIRYFRWLGDRMDVLFYSVDERLRFVEGEGSGSFVLKAVLGVFWTLFKSVTRFVWVLFLEPMLNPVKLPISFLAGKVLYPLYIAVGLQNIIAGPLSSVLGAATAHSLVAAMLFLSPNVFGFLVWELKENWRLYRASQPATIRVESFGGHGERVIDYLHPGIHSGTLPALFATARTTEGRARRKAEEGLRRAEEELRRFIGRTLLSPVAASAAWHGVCAPAVGKVRLSTNRIRAELCCPELGEPALLDLSDDGGLLVSAFAEPGWTRALDAPRRAALEAALAGFYKQAGVEVVRGLPPEAFHEVPLAWARWAEWWEGDAAGRRQPELVPGVALSPASSAA